MQLANETIVSLEVVPLKFGVGATEEGREALPRAIIQLMRDCNVPNGVQALGYSKQDIPNPVEGTMKQQRLLSICPRNVTPEDLEEIFQAALNYW